MDTVGMYIYFNEQIRNSDKLVLNWIQLNENGQQLIDQFNAECIAKFEADKKPVGYTQKRQHYIDLYSICDGADNIIYSGSSRNRVVGRLWDHVGRGQYNTTPAKATTVGKYLLANKPHSHNWKIILYDLPILFEDPLIWLTNPFFCDDRKPAVPSIMPSPTPTQALIEAMKSKKGHETKKINW